MQNGGAVTDTTLTPQGTGRRRKAGTGAMWPSGSAGSATEEHDPSAARPAELFVEGAADAAAAAAVGGTGRGWAALPR